MIFEKIKALCEEQNITISKLEQELGFGNGTIGKWKSVNPTVGKLSAVADFFKVPVDFFFKDKVTA